VSRHATHHVCTDPFADVGDDQLTSTQPSTKAPDYVHIRIQQRNGRKTLTTIQGLPSEYDPKKLLKAFKKDFACNGTLVPDEELGQVIQLQGDQRTKVSLLLVEAGIRQSPLLTGIISLASQSDSSSSTIHIHRFNHQPELPLR
jgi:translation initiation factor 1